MGTVFARIVLACRSLVGSEGKEVEQTRDKIVEPSIRRLAVFRILQQLFVTFIEVGSGEKGRLLKFRLDYTTD